MAAPTDNVPYPFTFDTGHQIQAQRKSNAAETVTLTLPNVRGRLPSAQASRLRSMWLESYADKTKILAFPCSYDALSSRLIEEAGFPLLFLSGYAVASTHGLPDTGYIAMQEMCDKIQETVRQSTLPVMVDGDTGYGGPLNVKRT
ncbi:carboxyvinyl-carboxyphosphonate phosphorylmutase, partial [Fusarium albosuccineum]